MDDNIGIYISNVSYTIYLWIIIVPYLKDNYGYIIFDHISKEYFLVDPGDINKTHEVLKYFSLIDKSSSPKSPLFILSTVNQ